MPYAINSPPATDFRSMSRGIDDPTGVFGAVIDAYREEAYESGYDRASRDVLDSLVGIAERYLRQAVDHGGGSRQVVYAFVEFLEREIQSASGDVAGYVIGGLGI